LAEVLHGFGLAHCAPPTLATFQRVIEDHIDNAARGLGYSSAVSCSSYVASTVSAWAQEASLFVAWRDSVWSYAFIELGKVQGGEREIPSVSEFVAELPTPPG